MTHLMGDSFFNIPRVIWFILLLIFVLLTLKDFFSKSTIKKEINQQDYILSLIFYTFLFLSLGMSLWWYFVK